MTITIISQGLFYREFKDVWCVYHIIGICIASGLNQCNPRLQLHKLPLSYKGKFSLGDGRLQSHDELYKSQFNYFQADLDKKDFINFKDLFKILFILDWK